MALAFDRDIQNFAEWKEYFSFWFVICRQYILQWSSLNIALKSFIYDTMVEVSRNIERPWKITF